MFKEYFYGRFQEQIKRLTLSRPNSIILAATDDEKMVFFGGKGWCNIKNDLADIPDEDRVLFVLSLFMVVATEQCLYAYFNDAYKKMRVETNFPKFGWAGFGAHHENPAVLLDAPLLLNYFDSVRLTGLMSSFAEFFMKETSVELHKLIDDKNFDAYWLNFMSGYQPSSESGPAMQFKYELSKVLGYGSAP